MAEGNYKSETGSVTSKDGNVIGYRCTGNGPAVILVHGGMMASQNFTELGKYLSKDFTVYIPDRRGRGMSREGAHEYGLIKESEDMQALVQKTGAQNIFGLSSGAIITMQTALIEPTLKKVAIYEPPLPFDERPLTWIAHYNSAMQQDNYGAAMAAVIKGTGDKDILSLVPRFILAALFNLAMKDDGNRVDKDMVPLKELVKAMRYDIEVVKDAKAILEQYKQIKADVLLLGGSRSRDYLTDNLNIIHAGLPVAKRITFKGIGHIAADNTGRPRDVAGKLKLFFKGS